MLQIFIGDASSAALVTIVANVRSEAVVKKVEVVRNMGDLKGLATIETQEKVRSLEDVKRSIGCS